jgi:glycerophosphoryl diester phosphodiesterase
MAPENTLEAAIRAFRAGADAWELDVQLSRDGVPVVLHDESLVRTTDVARRFRGDPRQRDGFLVGDFDLEEIQGLDAGSWFVDPVGGPRSARDFGTLEALDAGERDRFASGSIRIPTLEEALRLTDELGWLVNIEVKSFPVRPPGLVETVLAVLDRSGRPGRFWVSSFDHADVAEIGRRRPAWLTAVLSATPLYRPVQYVRSQVGARAYHVSSEALGAGSDPYRRQPGAASLRVGEIRETVEAGLPVLVFTVNARSGDRLADHLAEAGVTGLFTDTARLLARRWGIAARTAERRHLAPPSSRFLIDP